jgi:hypothetical protein
MQIVEPRWLYNLVACIGFICLLNSEDAAVASLNDSMVLERTGSKFENGYFRDRRRRSLHNA